MSTVMNTNYNTAPLNTNAAAPVHADMFSRDRDYNYGLPPSKTDQMKDKLGVANLGAEKSTFGSTSPVNFPSTEKLAIQESVQGSNLFLNQQQNWQGGEGFGTIHLKPICIEQEPVSFRPGPITIQQPPLVVQGETISLPQPPIVIHPEPIVIPQAPLTFTPQAITVPRPAVTVQPDAVTLARPSYSVQPLIQYDLRGCNKFGMADFSQHVRVRLTNEQAGLQSNYSSGNLMSSSLGSANYNAAPLNTNAAAPVHADMLSRDRDYNYGLPPSKTDKMKDSLGVANTGPQKATPF